MSEKPQYTPEFPQQPHHIQQPMGMPQMSVPAGGNRNVKGMPMVEGEREWSNGICGCFGDCGTFCMSVFFPCVIYGQNRQRIEHLDRHGVPDPEFGSFCSGLCWVYAGVQLLGTWGWIMQIRTRGDVRERYAIKGSVLGDCCTAFCCTACELTQTSREIELEEQSFMQHQHHGEQ